MKKIITILLSLVTFALSAESTYIVKDYWITSIDSVPTTSPANHFKRGKDAMDRGDWQDAILQFTILSDHFPDLCEGQEALYFLAVSYYHTDEYELANDTFNLYLRNLGNPEHFEDAIFYKFSIACQFKDGACKRLFGQKYLPKWSSGWETASQMFDEVITAVPCHNLAAWSLFEKADMLFYENRLRESVETFQQVIRKFPKSELSPQSYVQIAKLYYSQCLKEKQNPDLLALAEINFRRFQQDFPGDTKCYAFLESNLNAMKEVYAGAFFETASFYERKGMNNAAVIYYRKTVAEFPNTIVAQQCQERISKICPGTQT